MNEVMHNLQGLKPPFKYMIIRMGNGYPNTLEGLKKEISCKSSTAPPVNFSHASNLKCMICRNELLMNSTKKASMSNWIHVGQLIVS